MATIKSYTDLSQSKTLSKILPHESADMVIWGSDLASVAATDAQKFMRGLKERKMNYLPCWSLAALLSVIPEPDLVQNSEGTWLIRSWVNAYPWSVGGYSNTVDACVAMIEKLHEQNLL